MDNNLRLTFYPLFGGWFAAAVSAQDLIRDVPNEGSDYAALAALLILFQTSGESLHALTWAPVPGPVRGMGLLLARLCLNRRSTGGGLSLPAAESLLSCRSLFFVRRACSQP